MNRITVSFSVFDVTTTNWSIDIDAGNKISVPILPRHFHEFLSFLFPFLPSLINNSFHGYTDNRRSRACPRYRDAFLRKFLSSVINELAKLVGFTYQGKPLAPHYGKHKFERFQWTLQFTLSIPLSPETVIFCIRGFELKDSKERRKIVRRPNVPWTLSLHLLVPQIRTVAGRPTRSPYIAAKRSFGQLSRICARRLRLVLVCRCPLASVIMDTFGLSYPNCMIHPRYFTKDPRSLMKSSELTFARARSTACCLLWPRLTYHVSVPCSSLIFPKQRSRGFVTRDVLISISRGIHG
jgi:hypothetical protein